MYAGVIPLRAKAVEALGKYMSPDIKIVEDHKLIRTGPYRYLRHPLTLCVMMEVIGFTLIPNSYFSLIAALIIFCPFVIYRMYLEEKALIEKFGQEYLDYKKEVPTLLPLRISFHKRRRMK
jgi:protein-S-isoprenylcysteine O-methyltransferase Ste14